MESKLLLQSDNCNKIIKARRNFKKADKPRLTETYCTVRLEALEILWSNFDQSHTSLLQEFGAELESTKYITTDIYNEAEECYLEYKTELKSILSSHAKAKPEGDVINNHYRTPAAPIELPKISIPKFSGKYTEWITFRDLFTSLIHNNSSLDNVQKMHYLKSSLIGEAEQLLRQVPISDINYKRCWEQLMSRYDNKRFLSHFILKRLFSQRNITVETAYSLKELIDTTTDCLSGLSNLGIDVSTWDILIIHILTLKLDVESRKQWEFNVTNNSSEELPSFNQFKDFITNRYRALEFLDSKSTFKHSNNNTNSNVNPNNAVVKFKALHVVKLQCAYCSEEHKLSSCKKFIKETVDQRRDFVLNKNICFNCLGNNHAAKVCKSNTKCKLCHRYHHTLLHPRGTDAAETTGVENNKEHREGEHGPSGGPVSNHVACLSFNTATKEVLLATALVKADLNNGDNYILRALLDQGSQANFVTESTVQALKLKKTSINGCISGVGGDKNVISKATVILKVKSRIDPNITISVQAYVLKSITTFLPSRKVEALNWPEVELLELADPDFYKPNKIDLLLGAEVYSQVIQDGIKRGPNGSPVAQLTSLGWILSGAVAGSSQPPEGLLAFHSKIMSDDDDQLLKRFWELEADISLTKQHMFTEEENRCEELFSKTTKRDEEGRYIVRLPFQTDDPDCKRSNSRVIAEKRLKGLERKFKTNEDFRQKYKEVVDEYLHMEHMEIVKHLDLKKQEGVYLPHHAILREDKDTTKLRIVYDASCKGENGVSLNDTLMIGPTIQPDLRHLVMRWRQHSICLTADIVKMYRQVKVHEDDTNFQRILWRDEDSVIKDYKLLRLTFGTACAPFLAVRALQQVAHDDGKNYPLVSEKVIKEFYMDDLMTGCETVEEGLEIYNQMNKLLKGAGFVLQKWTTNSNELLKEIKEKKGKEDKEKEEIDIKIDDIIKILGLTWDRNTDEFRYSVMLPELKQPETKRTILAEISRLFDPLGWITPCIILAKAFIQKLWLTGIGWDEKLSQNILNEWSTYREELRKLSDLRIPRWVGTKSDDIRKELHGFCDASKIAYAAVVYIRVVDSEGNIRVNLVAAKSKVAPIKQISIPRLELCGAVLLTKLMLDVANVLNIGKCELHAWTDSTIVLSWLNSHPNRWKVFVANRVSEILTFLDPHQWSHIASNLNPADCASRGALPSELKEKMLWLYGPDFLKKESVAYEKRPDICTELEAVKAHTVIVTEEDELWKRFSSLLRLIRVVAYCRRFLKFKKTEIQTNPVENEKTFLSTEELQKALEVCIKESQNTYFKDEIETLKAKAELRKKSELKPLNPFLDEKGILRVGGRLEKSQLDLNRKHPILLPKKSHLSKLIIKDAHFQTLHGGPQLTLNYIINKYWILSAKQMVKSHIRKCVTCVKNTGSTFIPLMGQLPEARATPCCPFQRSGVDMAGPIQMRVSKGRGNKSYKGYICLFVCMSTRAVHLESVSDLTAQGFLQAFRRFVARRGHCKELWSDNGTNFVGAAKEIQKMFCFEKNKMLPELAETLANTGTSWHFIPPRSPNFGGLWEAGVKSVKFHLKRVIGESTLTFEEMSTVLAQIESCLNSRPLSRLDTDPNNVDVLTPGHFLVGEALVSAPDYNYEQSNVGSLRRWQYTQKMVQDFWRRWSQEYLTRFLHRYNWSTQVPEPKVGDVVVVKEDGVPPCRWLYGRIIATHPGRDNITRVVTVKTKYSEIKRPMSKMCVLPVTE